MTSPNGIDTGQEVLRATKATEKGAAGPHDWALVVGRRVNNRFLPTSPGARNFFDFGVVYLGGE